jgi:hypothetical protein
VFAPSEQYRFNVHPIVKAPIVDKGDFLTPFGDDSFATLRKDAVKAGIRGIQTVGWKSHRSSRVRIHVLSNAGKNIVIHFPRPFVREKVKGESKFHKQPCQGHTQPLRHTYWPCHRCRPCASAWYGSHKRTPSLAEYMTRQQS